MTTTKKPAVKIVRHFEQAVLALLESRGVEAVGDVPCALLTLANECDSTSRQLADDSRAMARTCTEYADSLDIGGWHRSAPSDYSTVGDISRRKAEFGCKRDALFLMISAIYGKLARGCFVEFLDESYGKVRAQREVDQIG